MLKVSAFYLGKKSFIPKKTYNLGFSLQIGQESSDRWRFAVPILREGFGVDVSHVEFHSQPALPIATR